MSIILKSKREIAAMREAGRLVAAGLDVLKSELRPGMTTKELAIIAALRRNKHGCRPSSKG